MSRVKAQQKCLVLDQLYLVLQKGESRDDAVKREDFCEPEDVESG